MIALAFVGLASTTTAMAQDTEVPTKKYSVATNSFWANWFVSAGVSGTAYYTSQEHGVSNNPFSDKRGTIGFTVAVGKWFTPGIGLRTKFDAIKGKQVTLKRATLSIPHSTFTRTLCSTSLTCSAVTMKSAFGTSFLM